MCLILLAQDAHPCYRLILAMNRDEYYDRPTAPAGLWPDATQLLAGRDLKRGGTWLGITRTGRIAAVTNYRQPHPHGEGTRSRGKLTLDYLLGSMPAGEYSVNILESGIRYTGFSLLYGTAEKLFYLSNREGVQRGILPGIHGLSNHLLDTPWPKVERGKKLLAELLERETHPDQEDLLLILSDRLIPPDEQLPDTGVSREWERTLSPIFINSTSYGTRSSTLILIDRKEQVTFIERSFDQGAKLIGTQQFHFRIEG